MANSIPWSYSPYKPFFFETGDIYINRISPEKDGFYAEWLDMDEEVTVFIKKRDDNEFFKHSTTKNNYFSISGLDENTDYCFYVEAKNKRSRVRIVRTGEHVGIAVNYLHPDDDAYSFSGKYLCSPSLVRHPDGFLLASMDVYKGGAPQNLTIIFRSNDDGKTWHYVSEVMPSFWGKLFIHKNELYLISCSTEYGDLLIGKSTDGGKTFCAPTVILRGSNGKDGQAGVHKNPQNVLVYNNRIYISMEWYYNKSFAPTVISCDCGKDLLDCKNWVIPTPLKYDPQWNGVAKGESAGCIEGTLVVSPENKVYNVMRYIQHTCVPDHGLALVYEVDTNVPQNPLKYSYAMEFPANLAKFMIKKDEQTGLYLTFCSRITDTKRIHSRNLLSLMASKDLKKWEVVCDLIDRRDEDPMYTGFQYVDFTVEGDDIIWLCRTAENGAHNYHDSNYITFHRIIDFRKLLKY
jgi:hypothetical protein